MDIIQKLPPELVSLVNVHMANQEKLDLFPRPHDATFEPNCHLCQCYRAYDIANLRQDKYAMKIISTRSVYFFGPIGLVLHAKFDILKREIQKHDRKFLYKCYHLALTHNKEHVLKWLFDNARLRQHEKMYSLHDIYNITPSTIQLVKKYGFQIHGVDNVIFCKDPQVLDALTSIDTFWSDINSEQFVLDALFTTWMRCEFRCLEWWLTMFPEYRNRLHMEIYTGELVMTPVHALWVLEKPRLLWNFRILDQALVQCDR